MDFAQRAQKTAVQGAILTVMYAVGQSTTFTRVVQEVKRTNEQMPSATGADKRHKVMADLAIIFNDFVEPLAEFFIRFLIEAALVYLTGRVNHINRV